MFTQLFLRMGKEYIFAEWKKDFDYFWLFE